MPLFTLSHSPSSKLSPELPEKAIFKTTPLPHHLNLSFTIQVSTLFNPNSHKNSQSFSVS